MLALILLALAIGYAGHRRLAGRIALLEGELAALRARLGDMPPERVSVAIPREAPLPQVEAAGPWRDERRAPISGPDPIVPDPAASDPVDAPATAPLSAAPPGSRFAGLGFEQIVGGRLPIWVGGAALAIAGFYLVALAIEAGLLAPPVRVALALLFGIALIGCSEGAGRWRLLSADPRVAQALAGAGIASLYAAAYLASAIYGLITPLAAFALTVAVTAAALALALRRGAPTAIMGLAGGFAAPLLALGGATTVPLLAYLALLSAGLFALAIRRGWLWLALATAAGSFLWMLALIARDASVAAGGFVLTFAAAAALATPASARGASPARLALLRGGPIAAGLAELAALIPASGFGIEGWGLYLTLSAGAIVLAWRDARLTPLVAGALALALAALLAAAGGGGAALPIGGAIGIGLLFGGSGHALGRRDADGWMWAAIGGTALVAAYLAVRIDSADLLADWRWGLVAAALAAAPAHLAWRSRGEGRAVPPFDRTLQIAACAAAVLIALAALDLLPWRLYPIACAGLAAGMAASAWRIGDGGLRLQSVGLAGIAGLMMLGFGHGVIAALLRSLGGGHVLLPSLPTPGDAVLLLLAPALLVGLAAWRVGDARGAVLMRIVAGVGLAAGLYALAKQPLAIRDEAGFVARGFAERAVLTQALFAGAMILHTRGLWPGAARWLAIVAVARVIGFDLALLNPAFVMQQVGAWPVANLIGLHLGLSALWTASFWRDSAGAGRTGWLVALATILLGGALLLVRQAFHGSAMAGGAVSRPEFYAYSLAALATALALLGWGAKAEDRAMRIAALGLLTAVTLKVFLVDAAALAGVLRALSFLGLGVALIAIGWAYGRFLGRAAPSEPPFSG